MSAYGIEALRWLKLGQVCTVTHEVFIRAVTEAACKLSDKLTEADREAIGNIKLVYGAGQSGLRGVTYYNRWKGKGQAQAAPFVEVCAFGQESWIQVAGTTLHELGHVIAGFNAGHGADWHRGCERLGLSKMLAAGTAYSEENFSPELWEALTAMPKPDDGEPVVPLGMQGLPVKPKACTVGIGTRGGTSRGQGSGSRYRLYECECDPVIKIRTARDDLDATCNACACGFHLVSKD